MRDQARLSAQARLGGHRAAGRQPPALGRDQTQDEAAQALAEQASAAAGGRAVVLLPQGDELVQTAGAPTTVVLTTGADRPPRAGPGRRASRPAPGRAPCRRSGWTFWPLMGLRGRAGVAGVEASGEMGPDEERLVAAMLDQGAVALERAELAAATVENEALRRSDKLRAALLNSISHDLRTPLATVLGSATTLIDYGKTLKPEVRADLLVSIREEAERLNRYVGDLLDMTRLEGGALNTRAEWTDVRDVLAAAIDRVSRRLGERTLDARLSRGTQLGADRSGPAGTGDRQHPGERHRLQPRRLGHRGRGL